MSKKSKTIDTINIKVNYSKLPNKAHLEAQIKYPHLVTKDRTKYDRKQIKKNLKKGDFNYDN